jgi:hypothetical protein
MDTNRCTVTSTTIGMFTGEAKYQPKRCPNTAVVFDGLLGHCSHHRAAFAQLSRQSTFCQAAMSYLLQPCLTPKSSIEGARWGTA